MAHGLTSDRTHASAVRGRRLTSWTMAPPLGKKQGGSCVKVLRNLGTSIFVWIFYSLHGYESRKNNNYRLVPKGIHAQFLPGIYISWFLDCNITFRKRLSNTTSVTDRTFTLFLRPDVSVATVACMEAEFYLLTGVSVRKYTQGRLNIIS